MEIVSLIIIFIIGWMGCSGHGSSDEPTPDNEEKVLLILDAKTIFPDNVYPDIPRDFDDYTIRIPKIGLEKPFRDVKNGILLKSGIYQIELERKLKDTIVGLPFEPERAEFWKIQNCYRYGGFSHTSLAVYPVDTIKTTLFVKLGWEKINDTPPNAKLLSLPESDYAPYNDTDKLNNLKDGSILSKSTVPYGVVRYHFNIPDSIFPATNDQYFSMIVFSLSGFVRLSDDNVYLHTYQVDPEFESVHIAKEYELHFALYKKSIFLHASTTAQIIGLYWVSDIPVNVRPNDTTDVYIGPEFEFYQSKDIPDGYFNYVDSLTGKEM